MYVLVVFDYSSIDPKHIDNYQSCIVNAFPVLCIFIEFKYSKAAK